MSVFLLAYYRVSYTMRVDEPVIDRLFGGCFAAAMMITIADIKPNLIDRYVNPYKKFVKDKFHDLSDDSKGSKV